MHGPYAEHLLDAPDVCSNCLALSRVERIDPTRNGFSDEFNSHYERVRRQTSIEYPGVGDNPTNTKGVFCACGVEGSFERLWDPIDIERERFRDLLKAAIRTLDQKGVTIKPKEMAAYALSHFDKHEDADRALATAIDAGIVAAAAANGSDEQLRADGGTQCDP